MEDTTAPFTDASWTGSSSRPPANSDDEPPLRTNTTTTIVHSSHSLKVGDRFENYEQLVQRLQRHTKEDFVTYWRRDTRTVRGALMKTSRPIAQKLRYYSVRYACVHGGQKFDRRGVGQRQKRSMRRNCPAHITLRASKCGDFLEVTDACNEHNHTVSAEDARQLPQNRRLSPAMRSEVAEMLLLSIDHRSILDYVRLTTCPSMTAKEMTNLRQALCGAGGVLPSTTTSDARRCELLARLEANGCMTRARSRPKTPPPQAEVTASDEHPGTSSPAFDYVCDAQLTAGPPSPLTNEPPPPPPQITDEMLADDFYISEDNLIEYDLQSSSEGDNDDDAETVLRLESVVMPDEMQSPIVDRSLQIEDQSDQIEDNVLIIESPLSLPQSSPFPDSQPDATIETAAQLPVVKRYRPVKRRRVTVPCGRRCARGPAGQLLRAQIAVLRAEKRKLCEETQILRLTKQQLLAENAAAASSPKSAAEIVLR